MERLRVDRDICYGAAECVKLAPTAFRLDGDGFVEFVDIDSVGIDVLRQAARRCPSGALSLEDDGARA